MAAASLAALQPLPPAVGAVQGERGEPPVRHHFEDDVLCEWALCCSVDWTFGFGWKIRHVKVRS